MNAESEMNTTRIEVPLPAPHFDDETTIATARQVVPIERARTIGFWLKARALLPIVLVATLGGGLSAVAVNYYEHRQKTTEVAQQTPISFSLMPKSEPSPVAIAASDTKWNGSATADASADHSLKTDEQSGTTGTQAASDRGVNDPTETTRPNPKRANSESDAAKLTRKRRVRSPDEAAPAAKPNGAGRIVDLFTGPNP